MIHSIIFTGGISLFSGSNMFGQETRKRKIFEFKGSNPIQDSEVKIEDQIARWISQVNYKFNETKENPLNISAEYSVIHLLHRSNKIAPSPQVIIFHTGTLGGPRGGKFVENNLEERFFSGCSAHSNRRFRCVES